MILELKKYFKILGKVMIRYVEGGLADFLGKEISARKAERELGWKPKISFDE